MKTILFISLAFLFISISLTKGQPVECKKTGGIFKTHDSYIQNQYSDSVCLDNKKNTIKQVNSNKVVMKSNGNKLIINAGEIYGFFNGENAFRYFKIKGSHSPKGYFKVEDTSGLIIYSQTHHHFRDISTKYYYSKGLNDSIRFLNINNLESDFKNADFIKWVKELRSLIDKDRNAFIINELYKKYIH